MAIETYLIEDSEKMISEPEHLDEWTKIVGELGLEGQQKLAKPEKSPIPFIKMNSGMEHVYDLLCPNHGEVKSYSNTTIPLRVLSLIALAEREKYFSQIKIWDNNADPDPIAVGYSDDTYSSPKFIIARWGDELRSFEELKQIAKKKWIANKSIELNEKLNTIQTSAEKYFNGDWVNI